MFKNIQSTVIQLKVMYKEITGDKYCERLHEDIESAIKKSKMIVQLAEEVVLDNDGKGPEYLRVASDKIDAFFKILNDINAYYNRLKAPKAKAAAKKRKRGDAASDDEED